MSEKTTYTVDASGKRLGRLASEVATMLMGKDLPTFARNKLANVEVIVNNIDSLDISAKKAKQKIYERYTGYPSGLRKTPLEKVVTDKGTEEVFRKAVYGMLPGNKLRPLMMKNLVISNS